jgi:TolB-like protein
MLRTLLIATLLAVPAVSSATVAGETVAVLYFENQGNADLEPLKVGLSQMLITDLAGTPGVTVVERAQLQAILDELELGHSGVTDPETAARVGELLGTKWLLLGSYFELMGTLRIDARLVRVETGEIVHAAGVDDTTAAFMQMEKTLASSFQAALLAQNSGVPTEPGPSGVADVAPDPGEDGLVEADGLTRGGAADDTAVVVPDPRALEAAVAFSEGLIFLDRSDVPRAREAFQQAVAANPALDAAQQALASLEI